MSSSKKICWVTSSYMLQVDLPLLASLNNKFDIDWYFWGPEGTSSGELAKKYAIENNISLSFIKPKYWSFNPLLYIQQTNIIKYLAKKNYSLYYFDLSTFPWLLSIINRHLLNDRVVIAMHHGKPHEGMRFKPLYFPFLKYLNKQPFYLQYFSKTQAEAFAGNDIRKKYIIPLALNDFGESESYPNPQRVTFTFFGHIIPTKNLKLLIEVGNKLWERYPNKFIIKIVGHCRNWGETYANLIKYKDAFDIDIRRIEESEIPNLFGTSNYIMLPYKAVTQSGPLRIAYGYNVPVIASDLEGFKESIVDGETGLLFESENVDSLYDIMSKAIELHPRQYENLKQTQKKYVEDNLSVETICEQYEKMFNNILNR